jgi:hypothetical protein
MSLQEVLTIKLKRDLLKASQGYAAELGVELDSDFINEKIQEHTQSISFDFNKPYYKTSKISKEDRCCARIWKSEVDYWCGHRKTRGDYCDKHNQMISEHGVLRFDDIRNPPPKHDLIKLKTGERERLYYTSPPEKRLQSVLDTQQRKVILATPKLIVR